MLTYNNSSQDLIIVQKFFQTKQRKIFLLGLLCVILMHAFLLLCIELYPAKEKKISLVQQISPKEVQDIKKLWEKDKAFLLDSSNTASQVVKENKKARYLSKKTVMTQREQKSATESTLPQSRQSLSDSAIEKQKIPNLSAFGIPIFPQKNYIQPADNYPSHGQTTSYQKLADDNLPVGISPLLNTQESIHYGFYARCYEKIGRLWENRISKIFHSYQQRGRFFTEVHIFLDLAGNIKDVLVQKHSGNVSFDTAAVDALKAAAPFQNPPKALFKDNKTMTMVWSFQVDVTDGSYLQPRLMRRENE